MEMDLDSDSKDGKDGGSVRRPMNAFLIFCKRHRSVVREKNPNMDNRSVTRILGELWAKLPGDEKSSYTNLAKEYKDAFMKANPDYKWYNPEKSSNTQQTNIKPATRPSNSLTVYHGQKPHTMDGESITPGKLADPNDMGGLSLLLMAGTSIDQDRYNHTVRLDNKPPEDSTASKKVLSQQIKKHLESARIAGTSMEPPITMAPNIVPPPQTFSKEDPSKPAPTVGTAASKTALLQLAEMCLDKMDTPNITSRTTIPSSTNTIHSGPASLGPQVSTILATPGSTSLAPPGTVPPGSIAMTPPWTPQYESPFSPKQLSPNDQDGGQKRVSVSSEYLPRTSTPNMLTSVPAQGVHRKLPDVSMAQYPRATAVSKQPPAAAPVHPVYQAMIRPPTHGGQFKSPTSQDNINEVFRKPVDTYPRKEGISTDISRLVVDKVIETVYSADLLNKANNATQHALSAKQVSPSSHGGGNLKHISPVSSPQMAPNTTQMSPPIANTSLYNTSSGLPVSMGTSYVNMAASYANLGANVTIAAASNYTNQAARYTNQQSTASSLPNSQSIAASFANPPITAATNPAVTATAQLLSTSAAKRSPSPDKPLTFSQIQETLIRRAMQDSYMMAKIDQVDTKPVPPPPAVSRYEAHSQPPYQAPPEAHQPKFSISNSDPRYHAPVSNAYSTPQQCLDLSQKSATPIPYPYNTTIEDAYASLKQSVAHGLEVPVFTKVELNPGIDDKLVCRETLSVKTGDNDLMCHEPMHYSPKGKYVPVKTESLPAVGVVKNEFTQNSIPTAIKNEQESVKPVKTKANRKPRKPKAFKAGGWIRKASQIEESKLQQYMSNLDAVIDSVASGEYSSDCSDRDSSFVKSEEYRKIGLGGKDGIKYSESDIDNDSDRSQCGSDVLARWSLNAGSTPPHSGADSYYRKDSQTCIPLKKRKHMETFYKNESPEKNDSKIDSKMSMDDAGSDGENDQVNEVDGDGDIHGEGRRKSKRSNRGQRYQKLISEGLIQSTRQKKQAENNGDGSQSMDDSQNIPPPKRSYNRRLASESSPKDDIKFKSSDFDLDAQIASLPSVTMDNSGKKCKLTNAEGEDIKQESEDQVTADTTKLNIAELHSLTKDIKESTPVNAVGSQKRKARKKAITRLIPMPPIKPEPEPKKIEKNNNNNLAEKENAPQQPNVQSFQACVSLAALADVACAENNKLKESAACSYENNGATNVQC